MKKFDCPQSTNKYFFGIPVWQYQSFSVAIYVNPLLPIAHKSARIDKISILKLEGIIKKISYERRDYESVDKKKHI